MSSPCRCVDSPGGDGYYGGRKFMLTAFLLEPAMNADTIREFVLRRPFEPFVIRMSSGESHEVHHPECVAVGKNRIVVTDPETDLAVFCALLHINSVETLQAA